MSKEKPLWQTDFVILLRWILFLPIGFILTVTLQAIPLQVVQLVDANTPESTLLTILGAVVAVPILIALGGIWFMGVLMAPYLNCAFIAPKNRISAVLYGMCFCLFEGIYLISILAGGTSWTFLLYQLVFSGLTLGGLVMLHKGVELSRFKRWTRWGRTLKHATSRI